MVAGVIASDLRKQDYLFSQAQDRHIRISISVHPLGIVLTARSMLAGHRVYPSVFRKQSDHLIIHKSKSRHEIPGTFLLRNTLKSDRGKCYELRITSIGCPSRLSWMMRGIAILCLIIDRSRRSSVSE